MTSFSDRQWCFLKDVGRLVAFLDEIGWKATGGDLYRSPEEQARKYEQGLSKALPSQSKHQSRMAIDLNFWDEAGVYLPHLELSKDDLKDKMAIVADYWKELNPKNRWGGDWNFFDPFHFERMF